MLKNIKIVLILSVFSCIVIKCTQKESNTIKIEALRTALLDLPKDLINIVADYAHPYNDEYDMLVGALNANKSKKLQENLRKIIYDEIRVLRENIKTHRPDFENILNDVINLEVEAILRKRKHYDDDDLLHQGQKLFMNQMAFDDLIEKIKLDYQIPDTQLFNNLSEFFMANRFKLKDNKILWFSLSQRIRRFCLYLIIKDNNHELLKEAIFLLHKTKYYYTPGWYFGIDFINFDESNHDTLDNLVDNRMSVFDYTFCISDLKLNHYL